MKHATDRRSPRELDEENRNIMRENAYTDLLRKMTADAISMPYMSMVAFLTALESVESGMTVLPWPDEMPACEARSLDAKIDRLMRVRPRVMA